MPNANRHGSKQKARARQAEIYYTLSSAIAEPAGDRQIRRNIGCAACTVCQLMDKLKENGKNGLLRTKNADLGN